MVGCGIISHKEASATLTFVKESREDVKRSEAGGGFALVEKSSREHNSYPAANIVVGWCYWLFNDER